MSSLDFDQIRLELTQKLQQVQKLLKRFGLQCDFPKKLEVLKKREK